MDCPDCGSKLLYIEMGVYACTNENTRYFNYGGKPMKIRKEI
jgi:hypothetical protein